MIFGGHGYRLSITKDFSSAGGGVMEWGREGLGLECVWMVA